MKRRTFLKSSLAMGTALSLSGSRILGANDDVRLGVIGVGSFVKIGGKGRADIRDFQKIDGVRVPAICDCDANLLSYEVEQFQKRSESVLAFKDFRDMLQSDQIDAVSITTPNHWHSLMAVEACRAGKDVFCQKPLSHNIYEGRKVVEAMRKYDRIVQATHGPRNSESAAQAFQFARDGGLGAIRYVHGVNYKPRTTIGKVARPTPIPEGVDFDLWCGPAPKKPIMREYLHYDWHWNWDYGNGDLGNMGIHYMDGCRWALGANSLPQRVLTVGGRLAYDDDGETPNTLVTLLDYDPIPIIFEVRGLPREASLRNNGWGANEMDRLHDVSIGTMIHCEGGLITYDSSGAFAFDNDGKLIKRFEADRPSTKQNFIDAMRSRDASSLNSDALEGHLSCGLVHLTNISYRTGKTASPEQIGEQVSESAPLSDAYDRMLMHLDANRIALDQTRLTAGPVLTLDPETEQFTGPFADEANALATREYRAPFTMPDEV
jgi:predicted dehydrogenase